MSRQSFRSSMIEDAIRHIEETERLLAEIERVKAANDMSAVRIPGLLEDASLHARLAETYSRLAGIEERR